MYANTNNQEGGKPCLQPAALKILPIAGQDHYTIFLINNNANSVQTKKKKNL